METDRYYNIAPELGTISNFKEGYLGYFDPEAPESGNAALDQLDAYISSHGPFQGVIAFSQGAQLAATYIAHKTLQGATQPAFGCAILFSPLGVYDPREWVAGGRIRKVDPAADGFVLRIPTLVVWGKQDSKWKEEAKGVSKLCVPGTSYTYEHEGGHEIPGIGATDALGPVAKLAKRCIMLSSEE